jgi:integrase/recombinase XerD
MSELRKSLRGYLALRRALGFKLKTQGYLLHRFVDFVDEQGASFITRDLALRWAMASPPRAAGSMWAAVACRPHVCGVSSGRRFSDGNSAARITA